MILTKVNRETDSAPNMFRYYKNLVVILNFDRIFRIKDLIIIDF